MALDLNKLKETAKEYNTVNMTEEGSSSVELPPEGVCMLRFVGYIEVGKQATTFQGQTKEQNKAYLLFELSGKKYPPVVDSEGKVHPWIVRHQITISNSPKSKGKQLFNSMNYDGYAKAGFAELLGRAYVGDLRHNSNKEGTKKFLTLTDVNGNYTIRAPFYTDQDGETQQYKVSEPLSDFKAFLWNAPDKDQWDSIYQEGEYTVKNSDGTEVKKSLNFYQEAIKSAINFKGSEAEAMLMGFGE